MSSELMIAHLDGRRYIQATRSMIASHNVVVSVGSTTGINRGEMNSAGIVKATRGGAKLAASAGNPRNGGKAVRPTRGRRNTRGGVKFARASGRHHAKPGQWECSLCAVTMTFESRRSHLASRQHAQAAGLPTCVQKEEEGTWVAIGDYWRMNPDVYPID